jgi:transposase-like protein
MDIIQVFQSFQTQEQAVEYLEKVRWRGHPVCPYCKGESIYRHASGDRAGQRWQCHDCHRAFSATVGTIFHRTHIPLRDWFLVLALMLNAKKLASSHQIARDIGRRQPTVWSMMHRIQVAMEGDQFHSELLHGIVEADETYVGGKPRKGNKREDDAPNKRGRDTKKAAVIGVVERGGRVIAKPAEPGELSAKGLSKFITRLVSTAGTLLITDEFGGYQGMSPLMNHASVNHKVQYVDDMVHTNTLEGFWALVKRAWYGQHHHYSRKYLSLYISEACYKYNHRMVINGFEQTLGRMVFA